MVEITRELEEEIRRRAESGDYATLEAFLRDAIAALEREQTIEALLVEGLDSGDDSASADEIESIREAGRDELKGRRG